MLEQAGRIVAVRAGAVDVCARASASCARCAAGTGCGGGIVGALLRNRDGTVAATPGTAHLAVGDQVLLRLEANVLVRAAAVVYLAPLAGVLAALLAARWLAPELGEPGMALVAVGGLVTGLIGARFIARRQRSRAWRPTAWPTLTVSTAVQP